MCLAVPGKIMRITSTDPLTMADVDFHGVVRQICLDTVDATEGDYIVAHAGVAISVMDPDMAVAALADLDKMADYRESIV